MDFTSSKRILTKTYSGANGKKISIEYNGKQYILIERVIYHLQKY